MSIQASKPNNRVFLLLGIILAALAFGGVLFALRQQSTSGATQTVVVAKKALPAGTTITADLLTNVDVPTAVVPSDAYTVATAVVGKTTTVAVGANDPIVPGFFAAQPLAAQATTTGPNGTSTPVSLETQITKGFVALAIPAASTGTGTGTAADLNSVGYYILPGDHIDIIIDASANTPAPPAPTPSVRYSFQDVPVLRVGDSGTSGATPAVYIVEVPRSQAELLTALVTNKGAATVIKYVLRPQAEWGKVAPDNSSYAPNYENANTGAALQPSQDSPVTPATLNSLFGG